MPATSRASSIPSPRSSTRAATRASRHAQRGAIGLVGALTLALAVLFTALVVDAGRLWFQTRQLQTVADLAAIEAGQRIGCAGDIAAARNAAQAAAVRNGYTGSLAAAPNAVELGSTATGADGVRVFAAGGPSQAVRVLATRTVNASLVAGGWLGREAILRAEAVAAADPPIAGFWLGSTTLSVSEQGLLNRLLAAVLGSPVNLSVASYQGLANASVSLRELLAASADIGTLDQLLATDLSLGEALDLVADALDQSSVASVQAKNASRALATAAVRNLGLRLGDLLMLSAPNDEAAASARLNALQLVTGAAMLANGQNAIALNLNVNVPGIASVGANLRVIEPPQIAVGPPCDGTVARTAQVRIDVPVVASVLGLARIDLGLRAQVAPAQARLTEVRREAERTVVGLGVQPGIANLTLRNAAGTGPARISLLLGLVPLADLDLALPVTPASEHDVSVAVDHPVAEHLPQTRKVSSGTGESLENALSRSGSLDVRVLSILNLGLINDVVRTVVSPLLGAIGRELLDPLLKLLGLELGSATVQLESVQSRGPRQLLR